MNFIGAIRELEQELSQNALIEVLEFEIKPPLREPEILSLEERYKIPLPEDIKNLYAVCNGVKLHWRFKSGLPSKIRRLINSQLKAKTTSRGQDIIGAINIISLEEVISPTLIETVSSEATSDLPFEFENEIFTYRTFSHILRPFDRFDMQHDFQAAAIVLYAQQPRTKVTLLTDYYADWHSSRIIYFDDYLKVIVDSKAITLLRTTLLHQYRGDKLPPILLNDKTIEQVAFRFD